MAKPSYVKRSVCQARSLQQAQAAMGSFLGHHGQSVTATAESHFELAANQPLTLSWPIRHSVCDASMPVSSTQPVEFAEPVSCKTRVLLSPSVSCDSYCWFLRILLKKAGQLQC